MSDHRAQIERVDMSLAQVRQAVIHSLPAGRRSVSPNGRQFTSRHFLPDGKGGYKAAIDAYDRYLAQVWVLGDRRPYRVEVEVTREKRVKRGGRITYEVVGHDQRLAKDLVTRIQEQLTKRREQRNIIDDFRVY